MRHRKVLGAVDGDPVYPRVERTAPAEIRKRPVGLDEALLNDVIDISLLMHVLHDCMRNPVLISAEQQPEGRTLAIKNGVNKLLVASLVTHRRDPSR